MARIARFTFVVNPDERRLIVELAARLQRSQSDAVRLVVLNAARQLSGVSPTQEPTYQIQKGQEALILA